MKCTARHRRLFILACSAILRHRLRHGSILLVYTALVFLFASVVFCVEALKREARLLLQGAPEIVVQRLVAGRHEPVPAELVEPLRRIPGVQRAAGRLWGYHVDEETRANFTLIASEDRRLPPRTVAVGQGVARIFGTAPGGRILLRGRGGEEVSFAVAEVFPPASELVAVDLIEMPKEDLRALFGIPEGLYTDITLRVANENERRVVASKIRVLVPDSRVILREEIARTYEELFDWRGGVLLAVFASLAASFLLLAWSQAAGLEGEEKREIGLLKAVGWELSDVLALKTWEAMVVSLTAFFFGTALAYLHVFAGGAFLFASLMKGWSVLYPRFALDPAIDLPQITLIVSVGVAPFLLASVLPSWRAAATEPDRLLRQA
mgnify:CR=1 FL=1